MRMSVLPYALVCADTTTLLPRCLIGGLKHLL
jgi:hypothetical protein